MKSDNRLRSAEKSLSRKGSCKKKPGTKECQTDEMGRPVWKEGRAPLSHFMPIFGTKDGDKRRKDFMSKTEYGFRWLCKKDA